LKEKQAHKTNLWGRWDSHSSNTTIKHHKKRRFTFNLHSEGKKKMSLDQKGEICQQLRDIWDEDILSDPERHLWGLFHCVGQ